MREKLPGGQTSLVFKRVFLGNGLPGHRGKNLGWADFDVPLNSFGFLEEYILGFDPNEVVIKLEI